MGSLYRPKYRATDGTLKESAVVWLKYRDALGVLRRESSGVEKEQEARRLLKQREGAAVDGRVIAPRVDKITVAELAEDLKTEYRANGRKSLDRVEDAIEHLLPIFGALPAVKVTSADVTAYQARRQAEGAANATINRECAALKRLFSLAVKGEKIHRAPHIGMLQERNIRTGFFEDHQYEAVRAHLPAYAQPVVTFAYVTGWRVRSEVLTLQWRQVDFKAGIIRLDPGTTKNLEGRVFVMTPELRATLEAQRTVTEAKQQKTGSIIPWVFHRTKRGRPLKSFRKAWQQACTAAGVPGRILHDFRRTAVRNLERAGIPRSVAMKMVGHKTESVYRRYAIVDEAMLRDAAVKLAARRGQSPGQSGVVVIEPASWKDAKKLVGRDGIEPPTPGFSVLCSTN
jgi:integrase